ncbi:MAG: hypothetical protein IT355_12640 [Gemmatimonadaceae bacterium]|nr:hypothetical protein [Gemmatimonadaceae bacterium]
MQTSSAITPWTRRDSITALLLGVCAAVAYLLSEGVWYGDGISYAIDIHAGVLVEPGHLLWRPIGAVIAGIAGLDGTASDTLWVLQGLSLLMSVASVAAMHRLLRQYVEPAAATAAAAVFLVSNGFWTYAYSGCSYSLSVLLLILALSFAVPRDGGAVTGGEDLGRVALSASFAALSAAAWGVQVIAAPAVWVVVLLHDGAPGLLSRSRLVKTAIFTVAFLVFLVGPLAVLHSGAAAIGLARYQTPTPATVDLLGWIRSSSHGIATAFGPSQVFRVIVGVPQSLASLSDFPQRLRLWMNGDVAFPATVWLGVLVLAYGSVAALALVLWKGWKTLATAHRNILLAAVLGIGINLGFALSWQGTDLERYFPSLPLQVLLLAVALQSWGRRTGGSRIVVAGVAATGLIVATNVLGNLRPLLAADSFRRTWLAALHAHTRPADLVLLFGNRKSQIYAPHDVGLPRVINVSSVVNLEPARWQEIVAAAVAKSRAGGGRIFVGESLVRTDSGPRDGWSFRQRPDPSPAMLRSVFLPLAGDSVVFTVQGERVWRAP